MNGNISLYKSLYFHAWACEQGRSCTLFGGWAGQFFRQKLKYPQSPIHGEIFFKKMKIKILVRNNVVEIRRVP